MSEAGVIGLKAIENLLPIMRIILTFLIGYFMGLWHHYLFSEKKEQSSRR